MFWIRVRSEGDLRKQGPPRANVFPAQAPQVSARPIPPPALQHIVQKRAERAGRSLQQYLMNELKQLTEYPTMDEVLDRIESRGEGELGFEQAITYIAEGRAVL